MAKESTYSSVTPLLTDLVRVVDDPGGTPATANATLQAVMDLFEANFAAPADFIDAITEISASLKSGADGTLITGTAGTSGNLPMWNADGDAVDSTVVAANVVFLAGTQTLTNKTVDLTDNTVTGTAAEFVTACSDQDFLFAGVTDDLTVGYTSTAADLGTVSTATTLSFATRGNQRLVNGGAFALSPPSSGEGSLILKITNNASAGAIDTSAFDSVTGDAFTTTNGEKFWCTVVVNGAESLLNVVADSRNA